MADCIIGSVGMLHAMSCRSIVLLLPMLLVLGCQSSPARLADAPRVYVAGQPAVPPVIDGRLDEAAWADAPWTDDFIDIEGDVKPTPRFRTRAKMLWDEDNFYVAAWMPEPHVWGTLTARDSIIYNDNDFEVFIDPDGDSHDYYELEVNALNTQFDLMLTRPYRCGGSYDIGWDIDGLQTAVDIDGTLNDASDEDRLWTMEIAIPWASLASHANRSIPPNDGEHWWVNFSRVEWQHELDEGAYRRKPGVREDNWVWSRQDAIDMHRPQYWGRVQFSVAPPGEAEYVAGDDESPRTTIRRIHAASEQWRGANGQWPSTLADLEGLWEPVDDPSLSEPVLWIKDGQLMVRFQQVMADGEIRNWQFGPLCRVHHSQ